MVEVLKVEEGEFFSLAGLSIEKVSKFLRRRTETMTPRDRANFARVVRTHAHRRTFCGSPRLVWVFYWGLDLVGSRGAKLAAT